jgi:hypothetical protein
MPLTLLFLTKMTPTFRGLVVSMMRDDPARSWTRRTSSGRLNCKMQNSSRAAHCAKRFLIDDGEIMDGHSQQRERRKRQWERFRKSTSSNGVDRQLARSSEKIPASRSCDGNLPDAEAAPIWLTKLSCLDR